MENNTKPSQRNHNNEEQQIQIVKKKRTRLQIFSLFPLIAVKVSGRTIVAYHRTS